MPGLVVFNRRWVIGSDELAIPFGISVILRTAWLLLVIIATSVQFSKRKIVDCYQTTAYIYFFVYLLILLLSTITDACITYVSSKGTIFDEEKRKGIPSLLLLRLVILILEAVCAAIGIYGVFIKKEEICDEHGWISQAIVFFNLVWVILCLFVVFLSFDSAGKLWVKLNAKKRGKYASMDADMYQNMIINKNQGYWKKTCRLLFCCTKTETAKDNVLLFAAKIFSEYFYAYTDLVPSDILAGMILLRQKQKFDESKRIKEELRNSHASYQEVTIHKTHRSVRRHQKTKNSNPFDMEAELDLKVLDAVTYFAHYALACYGWPMYCLLNNFPVCSKPGRQLLSKLRCCHCVREWSDDNTVIKGDNCCLCNFATQKVILNANNENFVYVCYSDEVFKTPFNVIIDHMKEAIVISCRGTLSLKDVLTDLAIEEEQIPGGEEGWKAHKGFLQSANAIKDILEEKELIEMARNSDLNKGSQNYKLVIVGHSLGAGTATLLTFLLRPKYPEVQCYAYGPSGSAVSYEASVYAQDFIHSVVLGKDIIGRLNLHTMHELQHNILQLLKKTRLPKWQILHGCMCQCLLCCTRSSDHSFEEYYSNEEDMEFEPYTPENPSQLYMAGKIVHICKTKSIYRRFRRKTAAYRAYWSTASDFQNILISNLMLQDHFPDSLISALQSILPDDIDQIVPVVIPDDNTSVCMLPADFAIDCDDADTEEEHLVVGLNTALLKDQATSSQYNSFEDHHAMDS